MRTETIAGWEATAVDVSGLERDIAFDGLSWIHIAAGIAGLPERERMAVCRAWAPPGAVAVRVYRTWTPVAGDAPPGRELRASCVL